MPFPIPTPEELTRRQEAYMEAALIAYVEKNNLNVSPQAISRAVRSPVGVLSAIIRNNALTLYENHLHLRWWGDQYFPDTAENEYLERHASIWGIFRRPATKAVGYAVFSGTTGTVIPAEFEMTTPSGEIVMTQEAETIDDTATVMIAVMAQNAGIEANTAPDSILKSVSVLSGLEHIVLDKEGLNGGTLVETDTSLRERVIEKIRQPAHGGASFDYPVWIQNSFPAAKVAVVSSWTGLGSVGVIVAMGSKTIPRIPTEAELQAMQTYINTVKPVTAEVYVRPVILTEQPLEIELSPDTSTVRRSVSSAVSTFFARESEIGGILYYSRLSEAISSATGEYSHRLIKPAQNMTLPRQELAVPGDITWSNS